MTWAVLGWFFTAYALLTGIYIVLENRRPQATFAWMLLFLVLPGIGLLVYVLFGRDRKAFSRTRDLVRQNLRANAEPLLEPLRARQDAEISRLEAQSFVRRKLMRLVRHNSESGLTTGNRVAVQQDATVHYPSLVEDLKGARCSIHLQYYIWADDPFTQELKAILIERAGNGVEVRLLYDSIGSFFTLTRRYKRALKAGAACKWRHFPRSTGCTRSPTATTARSRSSTGGSATPVA